MFRLFLRISGSSSIFILYFFYHICILSSSHFRWGRKWNIPKVNISYSTLMYWLVVEDLSKTLEHSIRYPPQYGPTPHGTDRKSPAKIGGRNSGIAPTATCFGVRLRRPPSQPDSNSQVQTRKTRITLGNFRGVFPILSRGPAVHVGVGLQGSRWARGNSSET